MTRTEALKSNLTIGQIIDQIYDDLESQICKNCEYYLHEVCCNDSSPLCADFVSETYGCNVFTRLEPDVSIHT